MSAPLLCFVLALTQLQPSAANRPAASQKAPAPGFDVRAHQPVKYHGRVVDKQWLDRMYKATVGHLMVIDGQVVDIGPSDVKNSTLVLGEDGKVVNLGGGCEVAQIIDDQSLLARIGDSPVFRVRKINTHGMVDDQRLSGLILKLVGTYQYVNTMGAKQTVRDFALAESVPPTRGEFEQAVADGLELYIYKRVHHRQTYTADRLGQRIPLRGPWDEDVVQHVK